MEDAWPSAPIGEAGDGRQPTIRAMLLRRCAQDAAYVQAVRGALGGEETGKLLADFRPGGKRAQGTTAERRNALRTEIAGG